MAPPPTMTTFDSAGREAEGSVPHNCITSLGMSSEGFKDLCNYVGLTPPRLDSVVGFINTRRIAARFLPIPGLLGEAIRAKAFYIFRRLVVEYRLVNQAADAGRTTKAVGIATSSHDKAWDSTTFADDETAIRCEGRPASAYA